MLPLLFTLFTTLFALHRLDGLAHPQLWAEDGPVFHQDADQLGSLSIFVPRIGYFHTLPRLIALLAHKFDPIWTPLIYTYLALLVSGVMTLCLVSPRMPGGRLGGLAMALFLVMAPNYSGEVFLTPTNLQWITAPFMAGLLLKAPAVATSGAVMEGLLMFLLGVTSPFSIVLAPLAWAWVAFRSCDMSFARRSLSDIATRFQRSMERIGRYEVIPVAFLTLAAVVQASAVFTTARLQSAQSQPMPLELIVQVIGFRTAIEAFAPQFPFSGDLARLLLGFLTVGGLGALALLPGKYRPMRLFLVVVIFAYLCTTFLRCWGMGTTLLDDGLADRYFYTIRIHLLWCCLLAAFDAWSARHWLGVWCGFLLGLAVVASVRIYRVPAWPDEHWRDYVPAIREGRPVDIPLNPLWIYHYQGR